MLLQNVAQTSLFWEFLNTHWCTLSAQIQRSYFRWKQSKNEDSRNFLVLIYFKTPELTARQKLYNILSNSNLNTTIPAETPSIPNEFLSPSNFCLHCQGIQSLSTPKSSSPLREKSLCKFGCLDIFAKLVENFPIMPTLFKLSSDPALSSPQFSRIHSW